jgi:hypothetical protein
MTVEIRNQKPLSWIEICPISFILLRGARRSRDEKVNSV